MSFEQILFYWFAGWLIFAACAMILVRNTARSALLLILAFVSAACLWILLEAEFLAITLILVYVGAVMVLFLFVVMMLNLIQTEQRPRFTPYLPLGILVALVIVSEFSLILSADEFSSTHITSPNRHGADYSNITELAMQLYTVYVYPFELAAVLLFVAIIATITLVHRAKPRRLTQKVEEQISTDPKQRMRLVSAAPDENPLP